MHPTTPHTRALGTLLGQAAGDALGTAVEFQSMSAIARSWPKGLREIVGGGPFRLLPGQITDDTEPALSLARSLADKGSWDAVDVARRYADWERSGPFDVGNTCRRAFSGPADPGAMRARASRDSQSNGALMRASPLGMWGAGRPAAVLADAAANDALLSHPHPLCVAANVVFTRAIAFAIETGSGAQAVHAEAVRVAATDPRAADAARLLAIATVAAPHDFHHQMGWVAIALQNAFYQLLHADSLEDGICDTVRRGGDTDTTAAIAGALLGAVHGANAVPDRWRQKVLACVTKRPLAYQCGDLEALATALLAPALHEVSS